MIYKGHETIIFLIREAMREAGINQTEAGKRIGMAQPHFSALCNNRRMPIYRLADIAESIGYSLSVDFVKQGDPETGNQEPNKTL